VRKILLFINGQLGLKVIDFVIKQPDIEISGVVINSCSGPQYCESARL